MVNAFAERHQAKEIRNNRRSQQAYRQSEFGGTQRPIYFISADSNKLSDRVTSTLNF